MNVVAHALRHAQDHIRRIPRGPGRSMSLSAVIQGGGGSSGRISPSFLSMVLARPHHQQPFTSLYRPWVLGKLNGFNRVQLCRAIQSDVGGDNMCLINESYKGHVEVVRAMLKSKGEDVNIMDEVGNTALIVASENGHLEVVCELLNHHGVDVKIKNNGGNTALIVASWMGHLEVVCALLNHD